MSIQSFLKNSRQEAGQSRKLLSQGFMLHSTHQHQTPLSRSKVVAPLPSQLSHPVHLSTHLPTVIYNFLPPLYKTSKKCLRKRTHVCVKPQVQPLHVKLLLRNYFYFEMKWIFIYHWNEKTASSPMHLSSIKPSKSSTAANTAKINQGRLNS